MTLDLLRRSLLLLAVSLAPTAAHAEMVLSQVIVDLAAADAPRDDIEVFNNGVERMYVQAEPFEILAAGTPGEQRVPAKDPETSGLLVSPQRLVLSPGERRIIRIAMIGERGPAERVYRVAIKPVVGGVSADGTAIKVLVGYDALVIVRPSRIVGEVTAERRGNTLVMRNGSNTSQEIFQGRQCDKSGTDCRELPAKRLYPGAVWEQSLPFETAVTYTFAIGNEIRARTF